jgi:hypothetical protein
METVAEKLEGKYRVEGHYAPQHLYLVDAKGAQIVPLENVIHLERLSGEFDELMLRYGLPFRALDVPKMNAHPGIQRKFTVNDFSPRTIRLAQRVMQ